MNQTSVFNKTYITIVALALLIVTFINTNEAVATSYPKQQVVKEKTNKPLTEDDNVVMNPDSRKYHKPNCRFAKSCKKCANITKAKAKSVNGSQPCKVCKP